MNSRWTFSFIYSSLVLETLGKGSYGKVKKIMDTEAGTFFAVKIVDKKVNQIVQGRASFMVNA